MNTTYTEVGSADIAGENICPPCRLDGRVPATGTRGRAYRLSSELFSNKDDVLVLYQFDNDGCSWSVSVQGKARLATNGLSLSRVNYFVRFGDNYDGRLSIYDFF